MLRRGQEYAKEAYENLPGARDVGRGMDYMREGWKDTSQMTGRTMGGGWLSGSWWPWNWSLWPWNWYRRYAWICICVFVVYCRHCAYFLFLY